MENILISIDSKYRDLIKYPNESLFIIDLDKIYKNIISVSLISLELTNSTNFTSSLKGNNYFTLHFPNKLNDPIGIKVLCEITESININNIINLINNNIKDILEINKNKYSYIFYLSTTTIINMNYNVQTLILNIGWYSISGLILIISNFIKKNNISNIQPFDLNIFDNNFKSIEITTNNFSSIYNLIPIIDNLNNLYNIEFSIIDITKKIQIINDKKYNNIIPEFEIDFNTNTNNTNNHKYLSLGYYLGFRLINGNYILTPKLNDDKTKLILYATKLYNIFGDDYIFLKINDWGNFDFFNKIIFSKFYLRSLSLIGKTNCFINREYIFNKLSTISKLDIELIDYLGNTVDLNGVDFSFTLSLKVQNKISPTQITNLNNNGYY